MPTKGAGEVSDLEIRKLAIENRAKARGAKAQAEAEESKWEKVLAALEGNARGDVMPVRVFAGEVPESTMGKIQLSLKRHGKPTHIREIFNDLLEMGFTSKAAKSRAIWNCNSDLAKKIGGGVFVRGKERGTWGLVNYDAPIVDFGENRGRRKQKGK